MLFYRPCFEVRPPITRRRTGNPSQTQKPPTRYPMIESSRRVRNGFDTPAELVARCRSAKAILLMKRDPQRAVVWLVMVLFPLMSAFIASAVVVIVT